MLSERAEQDRQRLIAICDAGKEILSLECGTFYWFPPSPCGALAAYHLRWIADELDRRTEEHDERNKEVGG